MTVTYKCPGCGAPMEYDAGAGGLVCSYCGTKVVTAEAGKADAETTESNSEEEALDAETANTDPESDEPLGKSFFIDESQPETVEQMPGYRCPVCGAELVTDDNTAATICAFCGSPGLIADRMDGARRPSGVIPFQITGEEAKARFLAWANKNRLAPKGFLGRNVADQMTGIYVPYWLYSYEINMALKGEATRSYTRKHEDVEYTYTEKYRLYCDMDSSYERIPADASEKLDDELMEKLEPFDYSKLRDFDMSCLSGYLAEKYGQPSEAFSQKTMERAVAAAIDLGRKTMKEHDKGYDTVTIID